LSSLAQSQILRILLVSTQASVEEEVSRNLEAGMNRAYRLHWIAEPHLAFVRAQDLLPHVILVDDDLGDVDPIPIIRSLAASVSNAAILFLVDQEHANEASQAVLVGARSFITKPIQSETLIMTLNQVLAWQRVPAVEPATVEGVGGRIIVFCAPKGGTGRTMLAINTAVALHQIDRRPVVIVDADYAAPALDVALNLDLERNVGDLLPRLTRLDELLIRSVLADHVSGVKVLLAPPPADMSGLPMDETAFAFLDGADRILMTVLPEMVGLRNTRLMLNYFLEEGYPPEKTWLVLNRATIRGGVARRDIVSRLNVPIDFTVPDDQSLVTHSVNRGVPLVLSHRRSAVARSIRRIAKQLAAEFSDNSRGPHEEPTGN